ncbi:uncharacterized protein LOC109948569 isoform X4 [Prunus persica]|uniref:uncharacterized protein LOC109948569 isoform X4 n=1 Tax=Prunus persica TaxID=3760 RepID=UPI0009AB56E1|nr:uncharacterized protein LOC109948569 isoform X4 [Prunus persica]
MLCPTPPQQQQPQSLQALARSQSLCLRQSQSPRTSQRCRSLNYNSGNDADYSPDFSNATIEFVIKGLNSLNIKKNLSRLPLLSKGSHDDNSNHYKQQYQTTGSDDSNPTESLLLSVSPHADTDQDELGNVTRVVIPIRVCLLYLALVPKLILTMMGETVRDLMTTSVTRFYQAVFLALAPTMTNRAIRQWALLVQILVSLQQLTLAGRMNIMILASHITGQG